jgi:dethiobiotin synthetase
MQDLGIPILLVAGSYLGTISHTLAAVAAMKLHGLAPHAVIINESPMSPVPVAETIEVLQRHAPGQRILTLPRNADAAAVAALATGL